jgi:hypothetical protein
VALFKLRRFEDALSTFEYVLKADRTHARAWYGRAVVLLEGRMSLQEGMRSLKYAASLGYQEATSTLQKLEKEGFSIE